MWVRAVVEAPPKGNVAPPGYYMLFVLNGGIPSVAQWTMVSLHFAPIGLLDMYNSGGAVVTLTSVDGLEGCIVRMKARGVGRFGAYSNQKPRYCTLETLKQELQIPRRWVIDHNA